MKIISWNTNGLRATVKQGFFEPLFKKYQPDIVCFQETKSEPNQLPEDVINLPGYKSVFSNPKTRKGYSGVAIYSKEKPVSTFSDFPNAILKKYNMDGDGYGDPAHEGRLLIAEFKKFYIVNVYTPNSKRDLSRVPLRHKLWDPAFLELCKSLEKKKPVIFCGDLNVAHKPIDLARPKESEGHHGFTEEEREGVDNIIKAGFIDTFRYLHPDKKDSYTYWDQLTRARDRNVGWRIDYFFISKKLLPKLSKADILTDYYGSDHCPILIELA
jgi:exodeoxyribonuclease-3